MPKMPAFESKMPMIARRAPKVRSPSFRTRRTTQRARHFGRTRRDATFSGELRRQDSLQGSLDIAASPFLASHPEKAASRAPWACSEVP